MKKIRTGFERFCMRHRNWGIPNLMLFVLIGNGLVYLLAVMGVAPEILFYLYFDKNLIMQGQVWRLITFIFLDFRTNPLFMILFLYVYYSISKYIESLWGTLRFNLYYFSGILMTIIFCWITDSTSASAYYVHLSLFIAFATLNPDSGFLMFFIIPVKGWVLVLIDLALTGYDIYRYPYPICLLPVIALVNYALFFGADMANILPPSLRRKIIYRKRKKAASSSPTVITFTPAKNRSAPRKEDFNHRCTVCGRTDVTNPELEFRYCSRCSGYHCYCEEHINNHSHIQ